MQNEQLDMLQIKIDRAKDALPKATKKAIDSVDWRAFILSLREKKGYSFEQLEDLELETELLLCGLLDPKDYSKTLEEEMKLPKAQIDLLIQEMNEAVFEKIKYELIKNTEKQDVFIKKEEPLPSPIITKTEEKKESLPTVETMPKELKAPEKIEEEKTVEIKMPMKTETAPVENQKTVEKSTDSLFSQKLSGSFKLPNTKTDYSATINNKDTLIKTLKKDPYRLDPNE